MKQWYVFEYRAPGGAQSVGNRAWKHPKEFFGPFRTRAEAESRIELQLREWKQGMRDTFGALTKKESRDMRDHFRARHLTEAQFKKVWGSAPTWTPTSTHSHKRVADEVNHLLRQTRPRSTTMHPKKKKKGLFARLFG